MKKLTVISCLSTLLLSPIAAQANWNSNWLLGISGGYNWYDADVDVSVDDPAIPRVFQNHREFDKNDWSLGILGGYQVRCAGWLYGAELSFDWANKNHDQNYAFAGDITGGQRAFEVDFNNKNDATVAFTGRIGYEMLCWLMPYVRAGIETSRNKLNISIEDPVNGALFNSDISNRSYRFIGGVGLEVPVPTLCGLTFRAEYNYHARNRTLNDSRTWETPSVLASTVTATNYTNSVKASFVYNFNI